MITRGTAAENLLASLARGKTSFDVEWETREYLAELDQRLLAYLAYDDKPYTIGELATALRVDTVEIRHIATKLTFLAVHNKTEHVQFRTRWFRSRARAELQKFRRAVHKNIAQQLLLQADGEGSVLDVALHYSEAADYTQVLAHLSPDHIAEIIRKAQSFSRIQRTLQLALNAARHIEKEPEIIRFAIATAIVADFSEIGIGAAEVTAWAALGEFDVALAIARASFLKEDKLHLLSIVARKGVEDAGQIRSELLEQITVLAKEVDAKALGQRVFDICGQLICVAPELALDLAERAESDESGRERMLTRLSLLALEDQNGERSSETIEKIKAKGIKLQVGLMQKALAAVSEKWTCEDVLAHAAKLDKARDRLYLLRSWASSSDSVDGHGTVIESTLDIAITATDYTVDATLLRGLAEGLDRVGDLVSLRKLIGMFDAQRGIASRLGPSLDFVRLQLLLAENETRFEASASETRLLSLFYEIPQIPELAVRAESWAWFLAAVTEMANGAPIPLAEALLNDATRELEDSFLRLLDGTADHYRAAAEVITATARWNVKKALELASMLNTETRRDSVLIDIADTICSPDVGGKRASGIREVVEACSDRDLRDEAVTTALASMTRDIAAPEHLAANFSWLLDEAKSIRSAMRRTKALRSAYVVACSLWKPTSSAIDAIAEELHIAWAAIGSSPLRVRAGFKIVRTLASCAPGRAREYLERTQQLRKDVGGLSSEHAANVYITSVRLAVRAFSGLVRRQNDTKRDLELLAVQNRPNTFRCGTGSSLGRFSSALRFAR